MITLIGSASLVVSGLAILLVGYVIGRSRGRAIEREAASFTKPVCPCGHVWGAHKDGQRCQDDVRRPHYWNDGSHNGYEWVRCACTKYHGPAAINEQFFYSGGIA